MKRHKTSNTNYQSSKPSNSFSKEGIDKLAHQVNKTTSEYSKKFDFLSKTLNKKTKVDSELSATLESIAKSSPQYGVKKRKYLLLFSMVIAFIISLTYIVVLTYPQSIYRFLY